MQLVFCIYFGITLLYAHYKNTFFLLIINAFWGVDSKYEIFFFRPALENPDNPEKYLCPDYQGFQVANGKKMDFRIGFYMSKE